jgi:hypothetical protein
VWQSHYRPGRPATAMASARQGGNLGGWFSAGRAFRLTWEACSLNLRSFKVPGLCHRAMVSLDALRRVLPLLEEAIEAPPLQVPSWAAADLHGDILEVAKAVGPLMHGRGGLAQFSAFLQSAVDDADAVGRRGDPQTQGEATLRSELGGRESCRRRHTHTSWSEAAPAANALTRPS